MDFSHIASDGRLQMVNITGKNVVRRTAKASGAVKMNEETASLLKERLLKKGDAVAAAELAGISAAKKTSELIPLCHNIPIDTVSVDIDVHKDSVSISAEAVCTWKTGIEMEVLTAVSVAALTIYDMCKAVDKEMEIIDIRLVEKQKEEL